jgi:nitroimidazol reductase NimA-like FMN-containing flavoprotein (pyridoxamine 5'-phosphate oxidase superfamily)
MFMSPYHTRHPDKAIENQEEIFEVIRGQRLLTIAMCKDGEPYLVTVNYAFDPEERCFYFHCATKGKKMDYIRANPVVWGQVLEDRGHVQTECEHHFRSVHFRGVAEVVEGKEEMLSALSMLIEQQEDVPGPVRERLLKKADPEKMAMVRVRAGELFGKKNG